MNYKKNMDKKNLIKKLRKNIKRDGSYPSLYVLWRYHFKKMKYALLRIIIFLMTNPPTIFYYLFFIVLLIYHPCQE